MQPAKKQHVEISFDLCAYLFLNLKCSKSLVDVLMRVAPKLSITITLRRIVSDVMETFEKHKDAFEEGVHDCTRLYRFGNKYIGVEPYFCTNYRKLPFVCYYTLRDTETPHYQRSSVSGINLAELCFALLMGLRQDANWYFKLQFT